MVNQLTFDSFVKMLWCITGQALDTCAFIMDSICKDVVDPLPYYEACKEDVCFFNGDEDSPCNSAASYFRECSRRGVHVDWRDYGRCAMSCPVGKSLLCLRCLYSK